MNKGYQILKVKDICQKASSNLTLKDLDGHDGKYPIFGASGFVKNVDFYHRETEYLGLVKDGSGIGRVMFLPPQSSVIGTLQYILPKNGFDIRYVGYCLQSIGLDTFRQGAAIPHIYFKDYGETDVFVSIDKDEQQRIVEKLDNAFAKIDAIKVNAEKNLKEAESLANAVMIKELAPKITWCTSSLSELCSITSTLVDPKEPKYQNLLHVGGANIESKTGKFLNLLTAKEEKLISGKYTFDSSMVLYSKIRPYLMKVARPTFNGLCSADMYPLKPNSKISKDFLYYVLLSKDFTDYAILGSARAGMPKVNRDHLFAYNCHYPSSLSEQSEIVKRIDKVSEKVGKYSVVCNQILNECVALERAILRKAFSGEL